MSINNRDLIYPCPFSKGYGIPCRQAWLLLKVFFLYRLIIASLFVILFYGHHGPSILGSYDTDLYIASSLTYFALALISGICIFWHLTSYNLQAQSLIFTDIILITLIMHASGGVASGMGILLAVTIAAGGLLIGGRCAVLFAAIASLAILAEQIYASQTHAFTNSSFTYTGMLGASFITISILSYVLASRAEQTEILAGQQKLTITKLEELNQYIIQHLQSGIIIVDGRGQIGMLNEAALHLLDLQIYPWNLEVISPELSNAFHCWHTDTRQDQAILNIPDKPEISIHFTLLPTQHEHYYMIILKDNAIYDQHLQQGKLASLGRLTASIAHEIRNPLGAISHAGQLLSECSDLKPQDKRLTEIILTHSERVNRIIEDILQLSKRKTSNREKIDLIIWTQDYLKKFIFANSLDQHRFALNIVNKPLLAFIDKNHLEQIMDNLCQNALKYSSSYRQKINLKLSILQHHPCIEVIDTGPGISPENIGLLFEPFFTTSTTGTGLGLYISRELAELNQAKLSYHLTEANGSSFRLSLSNAETTQINL